MSHVLFFSGKKGRPELVDKLEKLKLYGHYVRHEFHAIGAHAKLSNPREEGKKKTKKKQKLIKTFNFSSRLFCRPQRAPKFIRSCASVLVRDDDDDDEKEKKSVLELLNLYETVLVQSRRERKEGFRVPTQSACGGGVRLEQKNRYWLRGCVLA